MKNLEIIIGNFSSPRVAILDFIVRKSIDRAKPSDRIGNKITPIPNTDKESRTRSQGFPVDTRR